VAGISGMYAPIAFAFSAFLALITAFSYAELSARFPLSAGEVRYVSAAFNRKFFSSLIGWLIVLTGILSSAALAHATAGFIQNFLNIGVK
jgi:amino acid transporter